MEDALISPAGFMILSGAGLIEADEQTKIKVHTIDISAYVKYDELESYFRNKMFTGENPIFPMDIITNYL